MYSFSLTIEEAIITDSAVRQVYANPLKRDKVELYINIYTFIKNFVASDIDNYLTPENILAIMETAGVSSETLDNFEATEDGGLVINLKVLASQVVEWITP